MILTVYFGMQPRPPAFCYKRKAKQKFKLSRLLWKAVRDLTTFFTKYEIFFLI